MQLNFARKKHHSGDDLQDSKYKYNTIKFILYLTKELNLYKLIKNEFKYVLHTND